MTTKLCWTSSLTTRSSSSRWIKPDINWRTWSSERSPSTSTCLTRFGEFISEWTDVSTTILQDQNQDHPGVVLSASRPRSRPKNHNIAWWSRSKLLFFSQQSGLTNPLTFVFVTSLCGRCWRAYGKGECWRPLTFTTVYLYMYGWRCILLCYWANKRWWRWWCYASVADVPLATPLDKVVR